MVALGSAYHTVVNCASSGTREKDEVCRYPGVRVLVCNELQDGYNRHNSPDDVQDNRLSIFFGRCFDNQSGGAGEIEQLIRVAFNDDTAKRY
jgi:hypothetical protein